MHPIANQPRADGTLPSPWARNCWCPFIGTLDYLQQAIRYVCDNPMRCGLKPQAWNCVIGAPQH